MAGDRLTGLDASFLHLEDQNQPMHVGAVMIFEGDPPAYDDFVEHIESRLPIVPRYRQRLAYVPLGQGRPKWIDDPHFDLRFHVRSTALPAPGRRARSSRTWPARVFAQSLNRDKPLWEMWLVEGLESDRFAVLSKTHHAIVDGISGRRHPVGAVRPDEAEDAGRAGARWLPRPLPGRARLLAEALLERATEPDRDRPHAAARCCARPRRSPRGVRVRCVGVGAHGLGRPQPAPRTPYNVAASAPTGASPGCAATCDDVKAIKNELGGTVNDVILPSSPRARASTCAGAATTSTT